MFKYRFTCSNKDAVLYKMQQRMRYDAPCSKTIFGFDLYDRGIHFRQADKVVRGFYLARAEENYANTGDPLRVCFFGKFTEENETQFFDVYIYPKISQIIFLIGAFFGELIYGNAITSVFATVIVCIFGKGYYDMIGQCREIFGEIIN